ncbi:MAG TPA: hypothetical protein VLF93_04715 [Candidatus Saccharimonadales bacterium]|nr:hypothetical protein [Candidatus Saccharimonadales bacterium]
MHEFRFGFGREEREALPQFPTTERSEAEREVFEQEMALWRELVSSGEWREYEIGLPTVIGYVPPEEREFYSTVVKPHNLWTIPLRGQTESGLIYFNETKNNEKRLALLHEKMPGVMQLVAEDMEFLGDQNLVVDMILMQRANVPAKEFYGQLDLHIDPFSYVVNDFRPTEFYKGTARGRYLDSSFGEVALLPQRKLVMTSAPEYAIVRKGPLAPHQSHVFNRREVLFGKKRTRTHGAFLVTDLTLVA